MYKKLIQRSLFYKKKLGKINGFFAKIFKINILNQEYIEFYRSLSLWQKIKLYFARRNILIDNSKKIDSEFGVCFEFNTNQLNFYLNPLVLYKAEIDEANIQGLLSKVFRGRINLIMININLRSQKNNLDSLVEPISSTFNSIAKYLSSSFNYIVNMTEQEDSSIHKAWNEYIRITSINNFWLSQKPSVSWLDSVTTKYTDKQLNLNDQSFTTSQIRDLYCFLYNCTNQEHFISLLQSEVSCKVANYKGFGINLLRRNSPLYKAQVFKILSSEKFIKKVKKVVFFMLMLFVVGGYIYGWYQVQSNIKNVVEQIKLSPKYKKPIDEINLKNYKSSLEEAFYKSYIVDLAYHNAVKKELDVFWEKYISSNIMSETLSKTSTSVQGLALNVIQNEVANPTTRDLVSSNLWLWSKVSGIPQNVLAVWLQLKHKDSNNKKVYKLSFNRADYAKTFRYVTKFTSNIFNEKYPLTVSLNNKVTNQALELVLLDQVSRDHDLESQINETRIGIELSEPQRVILDHFIVYLELRDTILAITNTKGINDRIQKLSSLEANIQNIVKSPWDKKLASFMLQNVSNKFKLSLDKLPQKYYSYDYYKNNIRPLDNEFESIANKYNKLGVNLNPLYDQFKHSLTQYEQGYKSYYYQRLDNVLIVNSNDINTLIFQLKEINGTSDLISQLLLIQKNVLDTKSKFLSHSGFEGVDNFYKSIKSYNRLMNKNIKLLEEIKSNPEMLIDIYKNNKHPFEKTMNQFLKSIKLTSKLNKLISQAAVSSDNVTTKLLQQYIQKYWNENLEPKYSKVFDSFPFRANSANQITPKQLTTIVGKEGSFWKSYSKISSLVEKYNSNKWLTDQQQQKLKKMQELRNLLWDSNGNPKTIEVTLRTSKVLPSYSHTESSWYFFKDKKVSYYDGILSSDKNSISDIGVGGVKQTFKINWWLDNISSIALVSTNNKKKDLTAQQAKQGLWSFWRLLESADQKNNSFTWSFNNNETKVSFYIDYPRVWLNKN
ncbi:hypothetical protein [Francisella sp. LA112445]|uniref:hypothetical protein n=1 Tax=Francisella sp. LA112445 TaxID=1395624 RepID=UPI001788CCE3|nr:hypothetical protein [Francisella sp. LA112445]